MLTLQEEEHISLKLLLVYQAKKSRWCRILDIFLLESFDCSVFVAFFSVWTSCVITKAWVTYSPLGEVILASKLPAMDCTRPKSDDWIPVNCVFFDAATAADTLNHNSSPYEQQIPRP